MFAGIVFSKIHGGAVLNGATLATMLMLLAAYDYILETCMVFLLQT